MGQAAMT